MLSALQSSAAPGRDRLLQGTAPTGAPGSQVSDWFLLTANTELYQLLTPINRSDGLLLGACYWTGRRDSVGLFW